MSRLWVRALQGVKLLHFRATPWIPDESSAMLVRTLDTFRHTILSLYALSVYLYRQYPRSGHCILSCTRIFNTLPQRQRSVIKRPELSTTGERHITFLKSAIQLHAKFSVWPRFLQLLYHLRWTCRVLENLVVGYALAGSTDTRCLIRVRRLCWYAGWPGTWKWVVFFMFFLLSGIFIKSW